MRPDPPNTDAVDIARVLGDGPLREIGLPRVTATAPDRELIAVGGTHSTLRWHGRDIGGSAHPVAVYRTGDLTCSTVVGARWPVNTLAFHPTRPLLAIGTGDYNGGWFYQGELLLLDLDTGVTVSLFEHPRQVRRITWPDPETLALVLAVFCDDDIDRFGGRSTACTVHRDAWERPAPRLSPSGETPHDDVPDPDPAVAAAAVRRLSPDWAPDAPSGRSKATPAAGSSPRRKASRWNAGPRRPTPRPGRSPPTAPATRSAYRRSRTPPAC
jgi:hypothetical protein